MSTVTTAQKRAIALGLQVSFVPEGSNANILEGYYFKGLQKGPVTIDQEDMTHLMTESEYKESMGLMRDPGDVTLSAFFDPEHPMPDLPETSDTIRESVADGTLTISYRKAGAQIVFFTCKANVQEYGGFNADAGTIIMEDWKFKLTGKPTFGTPS